MNKIEIPLSKTKIIFGIIGSILFVIAGVYLLLPVAEQQTNINPLILKIAGIAGILFFGATGIYAVKKMFGEQIGLIIDDDGIVDNTHASSVGMIKWADITGVETQQVASTRFLLIRVSNPDFYLGKAHGFKKKLMVGNFNMYGTPITITSVALRYNFNELEKLINSSLNEYQNKKK